MDNNFKIAFLYGYIYREAEEMKENGLFKDLSIKELIQYIIENANNFKL